MTVMGFGTFDAFHPGHAFYLKRLKNWGDRLIMVIARDKNVTKIKGHPPHFSEEERLEAVKASQIADEVILGHEYDFFDVIRRFQPDIIGLGYDQKANLEAIKEAFPGIEVRRAEAHFPEKFKSSLVKKGLGISD